MMAAKAHWVSEVFPVKFSLEDFLDDKEADHGLLEFNSKIKDFYRDASKRVISAVDCASTKETEPGEGQRDEFFENKREETAKLPEKHDTKILYSDTKEMGMTSHDSNCIWTKEELDIFRDGFFHLKKRAVNLLILLSESKEQIKELKTKCRESKVIISTQGCKLSEQKKQNMKLNATIRELRKDLEFSEERIQKMWNIEAQLRDQNQFLKTELEEERRELNKARSMCTKLDKLLKKQKKETSFGYMQQENILKAKHSHAVEQLEKESKALKEELEKERNNHRLTQAALQQLRKHFANIQSAASSEQFLDIAEIDNFVSS